MSVNVSELARFSGLMAKHIASGKHSLADCLLMAAKREANDEFREVLMQVIDCLKRGYALSKAMALFPEVFDQTYVGMVRHGEVSATLDEVMRVLSQAKRP